MINYNFFSYPKKVDILLWEKVYIYDLIHQKYDCYVELLQAITKVLLYYYVYKS
jgi:hypothetical protein